MDDNKRIELDALLCEKEGMIAENYYRLSARLPLKYEEKEFFDLASRIRALIDGERVAPGIGGLSYYEEGKPFKICCANMKPDPFGYDQVCPICGRYVPGKTEEKVISRCQCGQPATYDGIICPVCRHKQITEKEEIELCERLPSGFPKSDHPRTTCWGEEEKPQIPDCRTKKEQAVLPAEEKPKTKRVREGDSA